MPELPEVEIVRQSLRSHVCGARLSWLEVRERRLRQTIRVAALQGLVGRRIEDVQRRAKYLLLHLEGGGGLILHLGMSGQLLLLPPEAELHRHDHLRWRLEGGDLTDKLELRFRDPRRFGLVIALSAGRLDEHQLFTGLGPEPFDPSFTAVYLRRASSRSRRAVKNMLMDARVVAGMGNIYTSEALWVARINPRTAAGRVSLGRWRRLRVAVREVLEAAIREGGTTLNDFRSPLGEVGYFQVKLHVYDREGCPCARCGCLIKRIVQSGRSTYYCTGCQH